jgi:LDH2 family malate/lactate/ureidoglycolate dehydrogenase
MTTQAEQADATHLSIEEARRLITRALEHLGVDAHAVDVTCGHLLDAEIRDRGGLERLFVLAETAQRHGLPHGEPPVVVRETDTTALVDGGGTVGYAAGARVTELAVAKARRHGIAVVGANHHRYSGVLGLYVERAAREGLVAIAVSTGTLPVIAPHGGREARLCTNPIAMGFPSTGDPIVWDAATAAVAGTTLARLSAEGLPLPEGSAVDAEGRPTLDPVAALAGALLPWGGHRGSGLAVTIQLLGMLCGLGVAGDGPADWEAALLMIAIDPAGLGPGAAYRAGVAELADHIRATPAADGRLAVRMPSDRSMAARARRLRDGLTPAAADLARLRELAHDPRGEP